MFNWFKPRYRVREDINGGWRVDEWVNCRECGDTLYFLTWVSTGHQYDTKKEAEAWIKKWGNA